MTFNASATKSHRLLEPCASAALLSFISSHLLRQALLHLRRFLAPRYRSWGLCCELATATGASTTEQKRSGCLPPVMRGASLSFPAAEWYMETVNNHAGTYSMTCDAQKMTSGTFKLPMLLLDGYSDTTLVWF